MSSRLRSSVKGYVIAIAAIVTFLGGCSTTSNPSIKTPSSESSFLIPIKVVDADGHEFPKKAGPSGLMFAMGAIAGSISGNPGRVIWVDIQDAGFVQLDLTSLSTLSRQARPIVTHEGSSLRVTPAETRFARLSTQAQTRTNSLHDYTEFSDSETGDGLVLVYFDRPCRLSGRATDFGRTPDEKLLFDYDVEVSFVGWTWLEIRRVDAAHFKTVNAMTPHPELTIHVVSDSAGTRK